jgi:hypothetical protein
MSATADPARSPHSLGGCESLGGVSGAWTGPRGRSRATHTGDSGPIEVPDTSFSEVPDTSFSEGTGGARSGRLVVSDTSLADTSLAASWCPPRGARHLVSDTSLADGAGLEVPGTSLPASRCGRLPPRGARHLVTGGARHLVTGVVVPDTSLRGLVVRRRGARHLVNGTGQTSASWCQAPHCRPRGAACRLAVPDSSLRLVTGHLVTGLAVRLGARHLVADTSLRDTPSRARAARPG